jgi:uncharacterized protein (DUF779 family)
MCCSARSRGCPFYIGAPQLEHWGDTQYVIDVAPSESGSFSLEAAD